MRTSDGFYTEHVDIYILIMTLKIAIVAHIEFAVYSKRRKLGTSPDYMLAVGCLTYIIYSDPQIRLSGKSYSYFIKKEANSNVKVI